uniref:Pectin acetylesterase n=1 Tax=Nicotiana sylvestris TaxID=4096 RepID=A0A1U7VXP1_NICSY|nr:PREDICTED: uncharacterized protein LOC104221731 [Nicotiana sylvestris]
MDEFRVEQQQSIKLEFENADVVEEILVSTKDIEDTYLVDSSVIGVEDADSPKVLVVERIGPYSKIFSTLCLDNDMEIKSSEPIEESSNEEQGAYILEFFLPESQDYTPHVKAKKRRRLHCSLGPIRFAPPPLEHNRKLEAKMGLTELKKITSEQNVPNIYGTPFDYFSSQCTILIVNTTILHSAIEKGAVCLDGSPPAYLIDRGSGYGVNNWLIHIEGGGWCSTISECIKRTGTRYGSSIHMEDQYYFQGILSNKPNENPDFLNWNRVKVKYCDGASFTGDVEEVTGLHFRGARVFLAIMEDLLYKGMWKAENAILSGTSAGGLTAILHCDKFRSFFSTNARVKCISDAGFFVNIKTILGEPHIKQLYERVVTLHGSTKNLPRSCTSSYLDPSLCFFPEYVVQHIRTPLFVINSAYDSWQINNSLIPYNKWTYCKKDINVCSPSQIQTLQDFRVIFIRAVINGIRLTSASGYFITSCHSHKGIETPSYWFYPNSPTLVNKAIAQAVGEWFFVESIRFQEISCPYPCGKFCQS